MAGDFINGMVFTQVSLSSWHTVDVDKCQSQVIDGMFM